MINLSNFFESLSCLHMSVCLSLSFLSLQAFVEEMHCSSYEVFLSLNFSGFILMLIFFLYIFYKFVFKKTIPGCLCVCVCVCKMLAVIDDSYLDPVILKVLKR